MNSASRSIACAAIGGSLQEELYAIAAAGFDAVELSDAELTCSEMTAAQIRALLDELGLVVDSFEVLVGHDDPAALATIDGAKIFLVQLADAPALSMDPDTLGRHFRCFPGQGALDVVGFAKHVFDSGYDGAISLDVRSDVIRAAPNRSAALDGFRSLVFVGEQLYRTGRAGRCAVPESAPLHRSRCSTGLH